MPARNASVRRRRSSPGVGVPRKTSGAVPGRRPMNSPPVSVGSLRGTLASIRGSGGRLAGPSKGESDMAVIEHPGAHPTWVDARDEIAGAGADEHAARDDLRAQIKRLELQLAHVAAATYPRLDMSPITPGMTRGPRVLG